VFFVALRLSLHRVFVDFVCWSLVRFLSLADSGDHPRHTLSLHDALPIYPTTVTVASKDEKCAAYVQNIFINKFFRVYTSKDVIGVELGGALKNIIALGAGISDGLGFGDNAKAALITRGLAEITRLGNALGANPMTFLGLCGVGDLIVTCTSVHSRNWRAGNMIGKGDSLDDILEKMGMVVEGVRTTKAAYQLSVEEDVDMPITSGIYDILVND